MINKATFELEHIRSLQKSSGSDPILIERSLYAFGLLEALVRVGMPFIFKGGTSLLLLLKHPQRLSTDIDIIVEPDIDVQDYIIKASTIFPFERYEEQIRIGRNKIVKRHFKFYYKSPMRHDEFHIILDILYEENHYTSTVQREIKNELLIADDDPKYYATVPSINCILGDKLTAFAPHTTGIPIDAKKELEIMKQLFDVATLTDELDDFSEVKANYRAIAKQEIEYRGLEITYEDVLKDTIRSAACIIGKGTTDKEDFPLYMQGAKAVSNHIFREKYSGEKAAFQACEVFCLAACILTDQDSMIKIDHPEDYINSKIALKQYTKLSYVKKLKLDAYAYLVEGSKLLAQKGIE